MNFAIISRGDEFSRSLSEEFKEKMNILKFKEVDEKPDIVFSIGGDGTFLRAVQKYYSLNPIFITINTGHFGYLCEFKIEEKDEIIPTLLAKVRNDKLIPLLKCEINHKSYYAINEFRIHSNSEATIQFDVVINDTFLESFRGDGVVISSSIGSSGVAKSLGGALVDNELELIEFVENAPISNNGYTALNSPFVLGRDKIFKFNHFSHTNFNIYFDSEALRIEDFKYEDEIKIYLSNTKVRVLKNLSKNYIKKTSEAFIR